MLAGTAHTDTELVSSMMQKITLLEETIEKQAQEIQLKVKILPFTEPLLCPALAIEVAHI